MTEIELRDVAKRIVKALEGPSRDDQYTPNLDKLSMARRYEEMKSEGMDFQESLTQSGIEFVQDVIYPIYAENARLKAENDQYAKNDLIIRGGDR